MRKTTLLPMGIVLALVLPQSVFAGDAASGKAKALGCVACHNAGTNNLSGKGETYLVTQMKTIRAGKKTHPPVLSSLSDQDINALASYLNGAQ